ncbi:venom serine carboxypeptidase-like [Macrosteles quadrilineatus]|uniref:venom serine carboxypeptidase-like n=1 Tax=Macrosteles quadrilineatus TaxID=74068 RepID=UPI0023E3006E|nr:venom serine carboxypeptidase-like [Macrosteles quadrilineatus]
MKLLFIFFVSVSVSVTTNEVPGPNQPLYLTPYIESGRIYDARLLALVPPMLEGLISFSGYLTVDKQYNSNLFFWFFPSETSWETKPVLLWLQGGPGASSLLGLLFENGPIRLTKVGLKKNPYSWSKLYNVIYIDNPVGSGFSFTNDSRGYPTTQDEIGNTVHNALLQLFALFPEIKTNSFFLTGESYAGKYIPSVAYSIYKNKFNSTLKINLHGLFIGNGMVDPVNMLHYGDYLYQLGLVDSNGKKMFQQYEKIIAEKISSQQWTKATEIFSMMVMDYYYSNFTLYNNLTGLKLHYNYINDQEGDNDFQPFVTNTSIRNALHVGENQFNDGKTIALALKDDIMKSVKSNVEELLENYRVLFYFGQLDVICAYPLGEQMIQQFNWSGKAEFQQAQRRVWWVHEDLAGYCKSGGGLTEVMVRNAGHLVPADQPVWTLELLNKFVSGTEC